MSVTSSSRWPLPRLLLEQLSRHVVIRRRLPRALGAHRIYVTPDASLRFWRRRIEDTDPLLLQFATELVESGDVVWDIGANVGVFSLAAAVRAGASGAVLALEPDPLTAGLLRRSSGELPATCARITVVEAAAADREATMEFAIARRGRAASHLGSVRASSQTGGVRSVIRVAATTLDSLCASHSPPRLVKIDTEGAELLCLRGASRLLSEVRPRLLCEVDAPNALEVGALLQGHGYSMLDASLGPSERTPLTVPTWNTLALPG